MSANGHFPESALAPIPGGRLAKGPEADSWNAMCAEWRRRTGRVPLPNGPASSYRTFAQQVVLRRSWCARGQCGNAATPGTSNHGLGAAVDTSPDGQRCCDTLTHYGWDKSHSDAPWESWHRHRPAAAYHGPAPTPVDPLTPRERRLVNELTALRRRNLRKWNAADRRRASEIKRWLLRQMTRIRKAQGGMGLARRRTRYNLLGKYVRASH